VVDDATFREQLRRLKRLIPEDPRVRALHDVDGDGEISGPEWERAVALLRKELEARPTAPQDAAPAVLRRAVPVPPPAVTSIASCSEIVLRQEVERAEVLVGYEQANRYRLLDGATGREVGGASESSGGVGGFLVRQVGGSARPLRLNVTESQAGYWMEADRPFALFGALAPAEMLVTCATGALGSVKRRLPPLSHRRYHVHVAERPGRPLVVEGRIWRPWTFPVLRAGRQVALIAKKWSGGVREAFTDADTFRIRFEDPSLSASERRLLVTTALAIDFDFFESSPSHD
jgi:hypothetical protein